MHYRKPQPWNWNPRHIRKEWQDIGNALCVGYPIWTLDDQFLYDIGPTQSHAAMTVSGTGGASSSDFGPYIEGTSDNDYVNTGVHKFRNTSFFAGNGQEWTAFIRYRTNDTAGGTIWSIAGSSGGSRQIQLNLFNRDLSLGVRGTFTNNVDTSTRWDTGDWMTIIVRYDGGSTVQVISPGLTLTTPNCSIGSASEETSQNLTVLARTNGGGFLLSGDVDYFYGFDRALSHAELHRIAEDPFGLLVRDRRQIAYVPVAGTPTLTAEAGTINVTGQTAGAIANRQIAADQGTVNVTGQSAGVTANRTIAAANGSINVQGINVDLLVSRLLDAAAGNIQVSGQTAGAIVSRILQAAQGTIQLTGQTADPLINRLLSAANGSINVTGQAAGLTLSGSEYSITCEAGSIVATGQSTALLVSRTLAASEGSINLSGQAADLHRNLLLSADAGSITATGVSIGTAVARLITADGGSIELTGQVVLLPVTGSGSDASAARHVVFVPDLKNEIFLPGPQIVELPDLKIEVYQ